jgi:hypothetical protein
MSIAIARAEPSIYLRRRLEGGGCRSSADLVISREAMVALEYALADRGVLVPAPR